MSLTNKNKLFINIVGLLILGLVASTSVAYVQVRKNTLDSILKEKQLTAKIAVSRLNQWSAQNIRAVSTLAKIIVNYDKEPRNDAYLQDIFEQFRESQQLKYLGYALDVDGYYYVNDWPIPHDYDPRIRPWYIAGKEASHPTISWPFKAINESRSYIPVVAPIIKNEQFIGVVSGDYTVDFVTQTMLDINLGMNGHAVLADKKGKVLLSSQEGATTGERNKEQFVEQITSQVHQLMLQSTNQKIVETEEVLYVISPINHVDWSLVLATPKSEIDKVLLQETLVLLFKYLMIFGFVMLVFYVSNRRVFSPLIELLELDKVTGLPNKRNFKQEIISRYISKNKAGLMLIISMDNFNRLNAAYSSEQVNKLLNQVRKRLQARLNQRTPLGQFSECRFITYLVQGQEQKDWEAWLYQLLDVLDEPYYIDNLKLNCTFSMGVCAYPEQANNLDNLISHAFAALVNEKQSGVSSFGVYAESIRQELGDELKLLNAMQNALNNKEFHLVFQPQVNMQNGKLVGVEALIRWHSNEMGRAVSPGEFIPLAEKSDLVVAIGNFVIESAIKQVREWHQQGLSMGRMSVNISPKQLLRSGFIDHLLKVCLANEVSPELIELEITETSVLEQAEECIAVLHELRAQGFKIAIDDFGTGYSSLEYLKRMPVDKLKIDRAFVKDLGLDLRDKAFVDMIIGISSMLKCQVLAEGVETLEQAEILQSAECYLAQGYYYSKPLTATHLSETNWLETN